MSNYACRICSSENRVNIEKLLAQKVPFREIAKQYKNSFDIDDIHLLEQSVSSHRKHIPKELTADEKELLNRMSKGEASFEEVSRVVAVKVFEKMLKNPDDFRYIDFFRTELLKIKQEETQVKETWAKEIIARVFSGKLPLRDCPKCGHSLLPEDNINGDLTN
ncbi:MAG: hypothetical protein A3F31_04510 [Candidatus Levybacteria bacterium RIFCSPHIGHO2_12_FULL_38_12]|nr:MAG: hypothetical protein A2770_04195 [Candidatus Levybacteria bacterium RIFCSPHIGHO2_01_FULL_38_12]OGH21828.1 MAG: hypothetical protein A3D75_01395 [Candidatus Levybacteria bacterium RIFCSPHIGHO2_02_FULL_37_18]OGH22515.1 MAG: hypothetical protein A3F31_04510 [Candidatus Levybacteria bacterium RIFCSPHIGHO2_12_FULL_38_12]OGH33449.1 MAG: hypothetical protein A3A47_04345 [Candidatus Levybacteria bacterium RIFCSPLOWO2_01_FULL_37_20]OGH44052.1 MAG: hypothetical protein A3J14_04880 [Candidatus Lev